ncbi:MAG TPA: family 78 glycoside hydrolase catalytic domain [Acidimicrobiales bacterium]|nr:family 78 glycoside hydrolase catalytic domain [Acidimicrobiales bacterium]
MSAGRPSFGRRAFLGSGVALSAGAAAATAPGATGRDAVSGAVLRTGAEDVVGVAAVPRGTLQAGSLTVNGLETAVGIDPDDCQFAWTLRSGGRGAMQNGYRIVVRRTDPGRVGPVWDSGTVLSAQQAFVPYGGPALDGDAAYAWTVQARGYGPRWGPVSAPMPFTTALREANWTAQWLEPAGTSPQPDRVTYLRTEVTPPAGAVHRATAYVSAAHTYRLYVNGEALDAWPSFSYPDEQYTRAVDISRVIRSGGPNALGILHRWYGGGQGRPTSAPGLLCQVTMWYSDGRHVTYGTDGTWRELPGEWLPSPQRNSDGGDFVEWVDGRAHPQGWSEPGFDDSAWARATPLGPTGTAPFTALYAQRTRIQEQHVFPVRVHMLPSGAVVADFGAVYAARPLVRFSGGDPGRTVTGRVGYLLDPDGQVSTLHGTQGTNLSFSYILGAGPQAFEGFTYFGFRYLQVDNPGPNLATNPFVAIARHAAMPDIPMASFSSGDRMLDAVWKLTAHSCLYCSQEQFIDTPTREKGQFVWDAANESEGVMRAYGDQNLTWQGLRDVMRGQRRYWPDGRVNAVYPNDDGARFFGTFTARYPEWLWRYYASTGDRATAILFYPSVSKVADWLWSARQAGDGLLYGLADQSNGDPVYGYDLSVAADTASNVLAVNAFDRVSQLASVAGDTAGTSLWQGRAAELAAAVNATLRRADGVYIDGLLPNGSQSSSASQEANALALAYGVVPAADSTRVGAYVAGLGVHLGPNHGLELLRGLTAAGMPDAVVRTLTDRSVPGWAQIVAAGGTFTWEVWSPSDLIGDSMSHGWGSSALVAMQETLLGVSFRAPNPDGTLRLTVAPPLRGLPRASGTVPTTAGTVSVDWHRSGRATALDLTMPPNLTALVQLPATSASSVREGGVAAGKASGVSVYSVAGGVAVLEVGSGSYRFTSS